MRLFEKMKKSLENLTKTNSGFTLVELIVVIAILAILAGVAIPAYSGYVEKAERAEDEQLLATVNTAFAAACASNGENHMNRMDTNVELVDGVAEITVSEIENFAEDYANFFGDTEGTFQVITSLYYDGISIKENEEIIYKGANGVIYRASAADVAKYKETTWHKELSSEQILQMVAAVADSVQDGYSASFQTLVGSSGFKEAAATALGIPVGEYDEYVVKLQDELAAKYRNEGMRPSTANDTARKELQSNIAVLVSANRAQEAGGNIMSILKEEGGKTATGKIYANLQGDSTLGFSEAALAYGLYNSYVHYANPDLTADEKAELAQPGKALGGGFEDPKFQEYLNGAQAQKDLEGLLASMNVISDQNKDTASSVVVGGLASQEMIDALNGILGD